MGSTTALDTAKTYRITGPAVWGMGARVASEGLATGDVVTLQTGRVDFDGDVLTSDGTYIRASSLTPEPEDTTEPEDTAEPAVPARLAAAAQAAQILSLVRGSLSSIPASEVVALATFLLGEEASA